MAGTLTMSGIDGNTAAIANYYPSTTDGSRWEANWSGKWEDVPSDPRWASVMVNAASRDAINKKEEVKDMRGVFHIVVVDCKTEETWEWLIVADSGDRAKIKALMRWGVTRPDGDVDDIDVICNCLGDIRKKE